MAGIKIDRLFKLVITKATDPSLVGGFSYWSTPELLEQAVADDKRIQEYRVEQYAGEGAGYGRREPMEA